MKERESLPILFDEASLAYNWKKKVFPLFSFGLGFGDGEGDSGDVTVRRFRDGRDG
ncbi:hypothetical protein PVK06_022884 [Gossypium arboreum]|uniref:Uncharacterized protein n=1 Tax=Gossypium arboreum TaxID=29729 RepID=A0ABR0P9U3_GOSAR|nr:hypothetical protein PVK06_022884 [Gossypium arboreum]